MKSIFKSILLSTVVIVSGQQTYAQGTCYDLEGCSDYSNFGYTSSTAATLEYDNYISAFHSSAVRDIDGVIKVWGEMTQADGRSHHLMPTPINPGNYPGLTGKPLKIAMASGGRLTAQYLLLTDDNKLWSWGRAGSLLDHSLTMNTYELTEISAGGVHYYDSIAAFQELSIGLPLGVSASDVKMMFGVSGSLLLTTCSGEVHALVDYWGNVGNGGTSAVNVWHKVQKSAAYGGGALTGIVAARGADGGFVALDNAGNLWTWGYRTYDGIGAVATRNAAVQMTPPTGVSGSIKMIGMTTGTSDVSYYVLYENGNLYALGSNSKRELGNWTTTKSEVWIQPRYTSASGPVMDNIVWISPQEHDGQEPFINVLTEDKKIFNWGAESGACLGRGVHLSQGGRTPVDPGEPIDFEGDYSNSNIISLESGGHTTMMLRECEDDFGYIGHRIHGSMGDNSAADYTDNTVHFNTNAVQVCGAATVDAVLNASVEGPYHVGNNLTLFGSPSGGTYSLAASSTAFATITDSTITFIGAGTVRADYTVAAGACGTVTVSKTFNVQNAAIEVTIPGIVWIDANGDAEIDALEQGVANGLWANLTDPSGIVITSVRVNEEGIFQFYVSDADLIAVGNYSVILTNSSLYKGDVLTAAVEPLNNFEYTGTNRGVSTGNTSNTTGILGLGDLSTITTSTVTDPANFGIQQPPIADDKAFYIPNTAFSATPPTGFIAETGYMTIPASSTHLIGYPHGGSLTGSDPEDCPLAGDCNTGTGTTFNIESINTNTKLYYDFGTSGSPDIQEIIPGTNGTIEDFDVSKLVIYGQEGSGTETTPIGFTYSITDKAGMTSSPADYSIKTSFPLSVNWLYFTATQSNNAVLLSWATATETNNKGYEIEHSINSNAWTIKGFVPTKSINGNSNNTLEYAFTDYQPELGINYYRLKQMDIDGRYTYSVVKHLVFNNSANVSIYPNPAKDYITVTGLNGTENLKLYDVNGRVVKEMKASSNEMNILIADLPIGTYQLVIYSSSHELVSEKVVKL